jgi:hypothetical protein
MVIFSKFELLSYVKFEEINFFIYEIDINFFNAEISTGVSVSYSSDYYIFKLKQQTKKSNLTVATRNEDRANERRFLFSYKMYLFKHFLI